MKVLVIGAGLAGISAACYLSHDGHEVTILERRQGGAMEASFANATLITCSLSRSLVSAAMLAKFLKSAGLKHLGSE